MYYVYLSDRLSNKFLERLIISVGVPFRIEDMRGHHWSRSTTKMPIDGMINRCWGRFFHRYLKPRWEDYRTHGQDELVLTSYNSPWKAVMLVSLSEAVAARSNERAVTRLSGIYVARCFLVVPRWTAASRNFRDR